MLYLQIFSNIFFFQPVPVKRKLKQQCEAAKEKVPHNVRQRYVNMFTEEFLKTTANVNEAFEKVSFWPSDLETAALTSTEFPPLVPDRLLQKREPSTIAV